MARLIYPERPQRRLDPFAVAEVAAASANLAKAIEDIAAARGKLAGLRLTNWAGTAGEQHRANLLHRIKTLDTTAEALAQAKKHMDTIHSGVLQVVAEDDYRLRVYYDAMRP